MARRGAKGSFSKSGGGEGWPWSVTQASTIAAAAAPEGHSPPGPPNTTYGVQVAATCFIDVTIRCGDAPAFDPALAPAPAPVFAAPADDPPAMSSTVPVRVTLW